MTQIKAKAAEVLGVATSEITVELEAASNNLNEAGTRLLTVDNVKIKNSSAAVSQDNIDKINAKLG